MLVVLWSMGLSAVFAQSDVDGSFERLAQSAPVREQIALQSLLSMVEQLERAVGREQVATLYVQAVSRETERTVEEISEQVDRLTSVQAADVFSNLKKLYTEVGAPNALRIVRNVERKFESNPDRVVEVLTRLSRSVRADALTRMIADHGGTLSFAVRAALRQARDKSYTLETPFLVTRIWLDQFKGRDVSSTRKFFLGFVSIVVLPVTLSVDLVLLPFQVLFWAANVFHDVFAGERSESTSVEGQQAVIDRLNEELRKQSAELIELRERFRQLTGSRDSRP